jgi:putative endonuclease
MLTNAYHTVLYTGVTSDLQQRVLQHRNGEFGGFTTKYKTTILVYFEEYSDIRDAIAREKQIKGWSRDKKEQLIAGCNPKWQELLPMEI